MAPTLKRPVTTSATSGSATGETAARHGAGVAGGDRGLILDGGWAADLLVSDGTTWVAWSTCDDPEPPLLAPVNWQTPLKREAPLQPGVTPDDWRSLAGRVGFALSLARLEGDGDTRSAADARVLTRSAHALEGPALAALPEGAEPAVLWAERRGAGHVLLACIGGRVEVVHEARGAMIGPRATSTTGAPGTGSSARTGSVGSASGAGADVWVAWQQWPDEASAGRPRIVVARRKGGRWSTPQAVSAEGQSSWAPALTAGPDGTVWCAWDGWDGGAYQVYVSYVARTPTASSVPVGSSAAPASEWAPPARVSGPSRSGYGEFYHLAPDVTAAEGSAWIVWNRSARWGEVNHRFNHHRSLHAARVTLPGQDGGAVGVEPVAGRPVLGEIGRLPVVSMPFQHTSEEEYVNPQAARIRLDRNGRPVVFFREFRSAEMKDFGWTVCAVAHTGDDWTARQLAGSATGAPEVPYGAVPLQDGSGHWLLAYHAADYAVTFDYQPSKPLKRHRLVVETAQVEASVPDGHDTMHYALPFDRPRRRAAAVAPVVPGSAATAPAWKDRPAARELTFDGTTYTLLYGDLHRHSIYSKCMSANDGDPLDHWRWVQDVAPLDFYALTEHLEYLSFLEWRRVEDLAESLAAGGVLALAGFELAIPPGHTNFFYADQRIGYDLRVACLTSATLADVWPKLDAWIPEGKVVAIRHHQGHRGSDLASGYAARYEPLAEVLQSRGEYPDWVGSLRRQGFKVGVAGATDHSRSAPIVHGLTGLWLPAGERTREGVLAGFRARRTFATNGARMAVFLSAESAGGSAGAGASAIGMGQSGSIPTPPRLVAQVVGSRRVESVAFYRDERLLHVAVVDAKTATVSYEDRDVSPGEHAYWVRVIQDRESANARPVNGVAYSSPVWVTTR